MWDKNQIKHFLYHYVIIFLKILLKSFLCAWVLSLHVSLRIMCVPDATEARRGHRIFCYRQLCTAMWVLGMEPGLHQPVHSTTESSLQPKWLCSWKKNQWILMFKDTAPALEVIKQQIFRLYQCNQQFTACHTLASHRYYYYYYYYYYFGHLICLYLILVLESREPMSSHAGQTPYY